MVTSAKASVAAGARICGGDPLPRCPNSPMGSKADLPCRGRGRAPAWSPRFRAAACRAGRQAVSPAAVLPGPGAAAVLPGPSAAATMVEYALPLLAVTCRHGVPFAVSQAAEP